MYNVYVDRILHKMKTIRALLEVLHVKFKNYLECCKIIWRCLRRELLPDLNTARNQKNCHDRTAADCKHSFEA